MPVTYREASPVLAEDEKHAFIPFENRHEQDDECVCIHCGMDMAENWYLRSQIPDYARPAQQKWEVECERRIQKRFANQVSQRFNPPNRA